MQGRILTALCAALAIGALAASGTAAGDGGPAASSAKKKSKRCKGKSKGDGKKAHPAKKKRCRSDETGPQPPEHALSVTPATFDFGVVGTTNVTAIKDFTITNVGSKPTGPITIEILPGSDLTGSAYFTSHSDGCTGQALPPQGRCFVGIRFVNGSPRTIAVVSTVIASDFTNLTGFAATISATAPGSSTSPPGSP